MCPDPHGRRLISAGKIGRPSGLRGALNFFPYGNTRIISRPPVTVWVGRNSEAVREERMVQVQERSSKWMIRLEGVEDRDAAEGYKNLSVFVPEEDLPDREDGEYYFYQLRGMRVLSETGGVLGNVCEVYDLPTTQALEIDVVHRGKILVPFRDEWVCSVSLESATIVVDAAKLKELF
ncbi:ribosome maturation factor RimM [Chitinivibrio alkaliphilus]|uniref:Ribosome maturation factor RimM n=1 Tax=Chitinivibrio alkaliphilus ACht1 TaxID=1313304 RepID=U7D373_9BACT|nr:ribosome maturation factor RimM [Chitinivibrio alkaliphilus]ERP30954.1 16S rRNA processing protein RimM [Chitinivibrio alkaliphilus ACht1]